MNFQQNQFIRDVAANPVLRNIVANFEVRAFIGCQFALESAYGESNIAKTLNNYCGMKTPHIRYTLAMYDSKEFAHYPHIFACVCDYVCWLLYSRPSSFQLDTLDEFKSFLKSKDYCPDKDYISRIETIYADFINYKSN